MAVYPTGAIHKPVDNFCYDTGTMSWVMQTCSGSSGGGGGPIQDGVDPLILATVLDLVDSNPLTVAIVDANGDQITSFGGGVQYTEGDVDPSITGTAAMMEGVGNTLLPVQGTVADGLLVNLGANNDVTVTGSVTANAGTNLNTSLLATEATLVTRLAEATFTTRINTQGQKTMAASTPVVIASDQTPVNVDVNNAVGVVQDITNIAQSDAWWQRITDGVNGPVAVKAAGVAADAAVDPAIVVRAVQLSNVNQGNHNNDIALPWTIGISDGAVGFATVKAASTPAAAADKALVVAISPNNTLSVGTGGTTQYVEDAVSAGGESLTLVGAVRADVPAGSQSADGDYSNLKTDEVGRLWVNARDGKVVDGQFYPAPMLASKLDEMILTNQQTVAALLLLINAVSMKSNVRLKDLSLN